MRKYVISALVLFLGVYMSCGKEETAKAPKVLDNNAKVVFIIGDVKVDSGGAVTDAAMDMSVAKGSTIITGAKSQCNVLLGESSYVSLKENTRMLIDTITKTAEGIESSSVDLKVGRLVVNPKKLMKDEEFKVKTPTAIAAVRGTKFVVDSAEGADVKIDVVEGKVEMKPRVAILEEKTEDASSEAITTEIQKQIDEKAVIIEANQSATIDAKSSAELSRSVETMIQEIKETLPAAKTEEVVGKETAPTVEIPVAAIEKIAAKVDKIEVAKEEKVAAKAVAEVKELDQKIEEDKKKQEEAATKQLGTLVINTPVKQSIITVNGKKVGVGVASLKVDAGQSVKIEITARDFEKYETEVTLAKDETKTVDVALVKSKLRDRMEWSSQLGSGVKGDVVFFDKGVIVATSTGSLVAMTKDGAVMWRTQLAGGFDSAPAVEGGILYAVTKGETLYALSSGNGKNLWSAKLNGALAFGSAPRIVDKNVVVATSSGNIYSFSSDGKQQWSTDLGAGIYCTPSFSDGKVFVGTEDQKLYSIALKTGKTEWSQKLDSRVVSSSPTIIDGKIFIGTFKGTLFVFNAKKGNLLWSAKTGGAIVSSPVIRKGKVYIGSKDGSLYVYSVDNGNVAWTYKSNAPIISEVAFNDTELYLASGKMVYALNPENGSVNWSYGLGDTIATVAADNKTVFVGSGGSLVSLRIDLRDVVVQ